MSKTLEFLHFPEVPVDKPKELRALIASRGCR